MIILIRNNIFAPLYQSWNYALSCHITCTEKKYGFCLKESCKSGFKFNVKIQSGVDCWSGCSGIGLERWTAAFLAQKGLDIDKWPETIAKLVGEPKELFKFL